MPFNKQDRNKLNLTTDSVETEFDDLDAVVKDELGLRLSRRQCDHRSYHEMGDHHTVERDVLENLRFNIMQLEDVHTRFTFMMRELGSLIKTR